MSVLCDKLQDSLGALFQCSTVGDYQRIRTPYLYPDGDVIDLYADTSNPDVWLISDFAETTRWLRMQTQALRRSPRQTQLLEDVRLTHDVAWYRGMLQARYYTDGSKGTLAEVVTRVAQAALRVSDLWFTMRTRAVQSVADDVADFLQENAIAFQRRVKLVGRSQQAWTVDFHTHTRTQSSLLHVLATSNRASAQNLSSKAVAMWYDLQAHKVGTEALQFVSLFDDSSDVWKETDFALLEGLSTVARLSRLDDLADVLQAA